MVALTVALAPLLCEQAGGAVTLGFQATASPDPVIASNTLTYVISLTNLSGSTLGDVSVTNTFSQTVQITLTNSVTTNWNAIFYDIGSMTNGQSVQLTVPIQPIKVGSLTNTVDVANFNSIVDTTNVVISVIRSNITTADLGVTIGNFAVSGFRSDVFVNDRVTYDVTVTNAGPSSSSGVLLTNNLPSGIKLLGVSPANQISLSNNSTVILDVGTLTNGGFADFKLTIQPTNSGSFPFSALISSNNFDFDTDNNSATTNVTVSDFLSTNSLIAFTNTGQVFKRQSGRLEQIITLSNAGASTIQSARIIVSGLTNWLSNATGTNNGNPFVVYGAPLETNQSVDLTFQYFPNTSPFAFSNGQLQAVEVTPPDFTVTLSTNAVASTNIAMLFATNLPPGYVLANNARLVVFTNGFFNNHLYTNRLFTMLYSDDAMTWRAAQPPFKVLANYLLWVDYGPPETLSNSATREYMIYINP